VRDNGQYPQQNHLQQVDCRVGVALRRSTASGHFGGTSTVCEVSSLRICLRGVVFKAEEEVRCAVFCYALYFGAMHKVGL